MTDVVEKVAPLGCPFCGDAASREYFSTDGGGWSIFCDGCHASAATCDTLSEAIAAWNTRSSAPSLRDAREQAPG